jgi:hypothetical protein
MQLSFSAIGRDVTEKRGSFLMKNETAREALSGAGFGPGREVFGFNQGTFSLIDLIDALADYVGEAECTIATWTAAKSDLDAVLDWVGRKRLSSAKWIVDRSFLNRQPQLCAGLRSAFGDDSIRVFRCHAKFVLMKGDGWSVTLLTSMNLNKNARVENYLVSSCPDLFREYSALVDRVFAAQGEGDGFEDHSAVSGVMDAISEGGRRKQKKKTIVARPW